MIDIVLYCNDKIKTLQLIYYNKTNTCFKTFEITSYHIIGNFFHHEKTRVHSFEILILYLLQAGYHLISREIPRDQNIKHRNNNCSLG